MRLDDQPTFFVDRSLGRYLLPARLRAAGLDVVCLADIWPAREQRLPDDSWLRRCAHEGWAALSSDDALLRDDGRETVAACGAQVFHLKASLTAAQQADLVLTRLNSITRHFHETPPPFLARVRQDGVRIVWPQPGRRS